MARAWPAKDVGPLVALIADPRHMIERDGTIRLSEEQAKAILDLRLQRLTALGRDEIGDEADEAGRGDPRLSRHPVARAPRVLQIIRDELGEIRDEFATPRKTELIDAEDRDRGRSADRARGCRRHRHPCRLYQAHAAWPNTACRAAAARAAPAWRRGTRISSPACSSPPPMRRCCSSPPPAWPTSSRSGACRRRASPARARRW